MNIQVGAGGVRLPGFLNVDVRKVDGVDIVGDAAHLGGIEDGTVGLLFGHALFEHLFIGHHLAALREWKRILSSSGEMIIIGIPDFSVIAELYLKNAKGIFGERFDLLNVYRYSHGEPEHATPPVWPVWHATDGSAPPGWIPQLHKSLFDSTYVQNLLDECGLSGVIFNYAYPGEEHTLNMGLVANRNGWKNPDVATVREALAKVPDMKRFANLDTLVLNNTRKSQDGLLDCVKSLDERRPAALPAKIVNRVKRMFQKLAPAR